MILKYFFRKFIERKIPKVNSRSCINQFQKKYTCDKCISACPFSAIKLGNNINIDENICEECYICTVVCSNNCFTNPINIKGLYNQSLNKNMLVIRCNNYEGSDGINVPCLAGLSWEVYATLGLIDNLKLHVDLSLCNECSVCNGYEHINKTFDKVKLFFGEELYNEKFIFHDKTNQLVSAFSRRELFSLLKEQSNQIAVEIKSDIIKRKVNENDSRSLLLDVLKELNKDSENKDYKFWATWIIEKECWSCDICKAVCPNSAWDNKYIDETHREMIHYPMKCKECNMCLDICPEKALKHKKVVHLTDDKLYEGNIISAKTCNVCKSSIKDNERSICNLCKKNSGSRYRKNLIR